MKQSNKIKSFIQAVINKCKQFYAFTNNHPWIQCIILGLILNLTVESLSRHSLVAGIVHAFTKPLVFLFNSLIITFTMSICTLFKRRNLFYLFFIALWLGFGIANCVLLTMRVTPLEWADLQVVKLSLIMIYLSPFAIIAIVTLILAAIIGLIIFFIKGPKLKTVNYLKNSISIAVIGITLVVSLIGFRHADILLSEHVKNLANAYKDYGFNYCFLCSMLDLGIDEPSQYEKDSVLEIVNTTNSAAQNNQEIKNQSFTDENGKNPNIIFLQLETFFDVHHLSDISFSQNPIPNFSNLHSQYTSGYLSVPSIGAGTANTEFEVISGMSLEYFGVGEYPYKTILQTEPCESICYNLKQYGYKSHAIHNNDATFYDRDIVFSNLGFDTFTSLEFMTDVEFTSTGWAKDNVLVKSISDALNSTEGSDFVYTISVQSHGKYPSEYTDEFPISVTGIDDEDTKNEFEFYINQLYEVDKFLGDLLSELEKRNEKTVVVMFGDHLPSFDISEEDLTNNDLFQTEYVVWDNFGLAKKDKDIKAFQLGADIMGKLGFDNGILTKLHQNFANDTNYFDYLGVLEYDMLYGEKYTWGGKESYPYASTQLQMGVNEIIVSEVDILSNDGCLTIKGENFTPYSKVYINNDEFDTQLIDSNNLLVSEAYTKAGDIISVVQIDDDGKELNCSKNYLVGGTVEKPTISVDSQNIIIYRTRGLSTGTIIVIVISSLAVISACVYLTILLMKKKRCNK